MYQSGLTIKDALKSVSQNVYVLPAIQREFVWKPEQICRLFDSLMQGYPFGTFLFWKVEPANSSNFKFYGFVQNYHERDAAHCPELGTLPNQELTAVLDGQQRLTALNIGLRGSMASKEPKLWWNNPNAFPKKTLHLDLLTLGTADEDGDLYTFKFLEPAKAEADATTLWYPVTEVLSVTNPARLSQWIVSKLHNQGRSGDANYDEVFETASDALFRLYEVVTTPRLTYYTEGSQAIDRVLRIFIRMNSGGTVLSYSDLLLSIAVAQWSKLDARQEIHNLVDTLNTIGTGFNFSKDFVLKAGLMLAEIAGVGFKVTNFNRTNMAILETQWGVIRHALILSVELAASFGLAGQTLRADSALLPIAYYLLKRNPPPNYLLHPSFATERDTIRKWLFRSLLKSSGIWGSGLDTLLTALRDVVQSNHVSGFPAVELEHIMASRGKSLVFGAEEIEDLLDMEYGDRRLFLLLSLLYPFIDPRQSHHIDHFFPRSRLQPGRLQKAGYDAATVSECVTGRDRLPNLQLLEGLLNVSKNDSLPSDWITKTYPDTATRDAVLQRHDLGVVPTSEAQVPDFYKARREKMKTRLATLLS